VYELMSKWKASYISGKIINNAQKPPMVPANHVEENPESLIDSLLVEMASRRTESMTKANGSTSSQERYRGTPGNSLKYT
jgi:hypothetical protein